MNLNLPREAVSDRVSLSRRIKAGERTTMASLEGPGCIRRLWVTDGRRGNGRQVVIRIYFDDEPVPHVEAPFGDFFGVMHGLPWYPINTPHLSAQNYSGYNCFFDMPFARSARIEMDRGAGDTPIFLFVDWHRFPGQELEEPRRFCARWRREAPAESYGEDFLLLDADGPGRLVGFVYGVRLYDDTDRWSHGGADNIYIDGDGEHPAYDGSGIEDLITVGLDIPRGLALDPSAGRLYWTDNGTGRIQRADLDGSGIEEIIATGLEIPRALVLDAAGGKLYWADSGSDRIQRANLDGSGIEDLVTGLSSPRGLALVRMASPDEVRVPDAALRAVLEDSLGLRPGDPILAAELAELTVLEAPVAGIVDLTGLEHATGLTRLDLGGDLDGPWANSNEVSDLSPLTALTDLTWLDLSGNSVKDVTPLAGLTGLTWLNLQVNMVSDVASLSGLTSLTDLYLVYNPLRDASSLSHLPTLTVHDFPARYADDRFPNVDHNLIRIVHFYEEALAKGTVRDLVAPGPCRRLSGSELLEWRNPSEPVPPVGVTVVTDTPENADAVGQFLEEHGITLWWPSRGPPGRASARFSPVFPYPCWRLSSRVPA